jgi:3-deoxy-manno-octulosonate cytidylyltransferase (CMP-KDO synthetase)
VVIATDDPRVREAAEAFGAEVLMTAPEHASGTDRLAEVVVQLELADEAIVVNVQGDEPLIPPAVIEQVAANLATAEEAAIATLCEPIEDVARLRDPAVVKVVTDHRGLALYFSRAVIPWPRDMQPTDPLEPGLWWRHLGLYAYRAGFLRRFTAWEVAPIERLESLEQLRALYNGERIHVAAACAPVPGGVDTAEDLAAVRELLESNA